MPRLAIIVAALAFTALASCSRALFIQASGSIDSDIRFEFFDDPDRKSKGRYRVTLVSLARVDRGGGETEIWKLTGEARLSEIEYRAVPTGLSEETPPQPLVLGKVYLIEVHEKPFAIGMTLFRFSDMGQIEECRSLLECLSDE